MLHETAFSTTYRLSLCERASKLQLRVEGRLNKLLEQTTHRTQSWFFRVKSNLCWTLHSLKHWPEHLDRTVNIFHDSLSIGENFQNLVVGRTELISLTLGDWIYLLERLLLLRELYSCAIISRVFSSFCNFIVLAWIYTLHCSLRENLRDSRHMDINCRKTSVETDRRESNSQRRMRVMTKPDS